MMTSFSFFAVHYFFKEHNTFSDISDRCFKAAFTQFWRKIDINIKYFKKSAAHLQIFHGTQFGKHCFTVLAERLARAIVEQVLEYKS